MAAVIVQQNSGFANSGTSLATTLPAGTTAGNTLLIWATGLFFVTTPAGFVNDLTTPASGNHQVKAKLMRKATTAGETAWTITVDNYGGAWWVAEVAGIETGPDRTAVNVLDPLVSSISTGTTTTTTTANQWAVAAVGTSVTTGAASSLSGWTNSFVETAEARATGGTYPASVGVALRTLTSTGTYETTATLSPSAYAAAGIATYRLAVVPKAGTDTATIAGDDTSSVFKFVLKDAADSVSVGVTDTAFVGTPVEKAGGDAATVSVSDTAVVSKPIDQPAISDTLSLAVVDDRVLLRGQAISDALALSVTDTTVRDTLGPVTGTRVSPALAIPDGPIVASRILWEATPGVGTVTVETSIDNGATWQPAPSGTSVARLVQGDNRTARTVLTRVTMTRPTAEDPTPRLHRLEVEVAVDSSREEVVPVGVFTLNDVEVDDSPRGLSIELAGADLSRRISRNRWEDTYIVSENTNYATAIQDMIRNRLPDTVFNFASTARLTPRLFFGEQSSNDPWQDAQDMAVAIGFELFFDARGICTLRPEPDPDVGDSVWEFEDFTRPTMLDLVRRVTDENTYNKVIVIGEGSGLTAPVRATAIDADPASPTYYLGNYGIVTLIVRSPMILTVEQAQDAADALLRRVKGATEAVELSVIPMPAVEPGDVVTVTRSRSKVEGRFLIDQIRIPLGADEAMRAVGRRQRQ